MNVLITGGAGFIGSHLVKYHLNKQDSVWAIDNLTSGKLSNLPTSSKLRFDEQDVCTWPQLDEAVKWADRIYHMAAIVGQRCVIQDPLRVLEVGIGSTERILNLLSKSSKKISLLIASSSAVYGYHDIQSFKEDAPLQVLSGEYIQQSYSLSKVMNELSALCYRSQKGVECTIARLFNVAGVNQTGRYGMVIPNFISNALNGKPLFIYGDGQQTRSFCNVLDIVRGLDLILSNPNIRGEIINIGSDEEISILDLAHLICKKTNSSSKIEFLSYKDAYGIDFQDIRKKRPCLEKLRKLTTYQPQYNLDQTLTQIIDSLNTPSM